MKNFTVAMLTVTGLQGCSTIKCQTGDRVTNIMFVGDDAQNVSPTICAGLTESKELVEKAPASTELGHGDKGAWDPSVFAEVNRAAFNRGKIPLQIDLAEDSKPSPVEHIPPKVPKSAVSGNIKPHSDKNSQKIQKSVLKDKKPKDNKEGSFLENWTQKAKKAWSELVK